MKEEFRLSLSICEEIIAGKVNIDQTLVVQMIIISKQYPLFNQTDVIIQATWEKLFESPNFFLKYRHYIVLEASSATEADQIQWYGHVESKVTNNY